jgi:Tfp pilus assembly protein FimV
MFRISIPLMSFCWALSVGLTAPTWAADLSASAGHTYTVKPGDTLDKVIRQQMAGSPLRTDILRDALITQNPGAFAKGSPKILLSGAVLQLPDQEALMRKHLSASTSGAAAPVAAAEGAGADRALATRRHWVRYP